MDKKNSKAKIIITVVVLISTLAFVGLGTYAWYTISTRGLAGGIEVSMPRNGDEWPFEFIEQRDNDNWATIGEVWDAASRSEDDGWGKHVTLSWVHFKDTNGNMVATPANDCYQLRPISTSDLETWYLPQYTGKGEVSYLVSATLGEIGNINRYNPTASETGEDIPSNYVYYYDLWVRNLSDKFDYELHLNNPLDQEEADADKYEEYNYGTYVLPGLVQGAGGKAKLSESGYDMSTCMRIGFAIYDTDHENIEDQQIESFWIYEPNCDLRARNFTEYEKTSPFGYDFQKGFTYILGNNNQNKSVLSHATLSEGDIQTMLPDGEMGKEHQQFKEIDDKTIKQLHSAWKSDIDFTRVSSLDSTDVDYFGRFISEATEDESLVTQGIDTPNFKKVVKGTPVHVRVFIWMEGQDVDCWNSSLQGSLKIGLEFRGKGILK